MGGRGSSCRWYSGAPSAGRPTRGTRSGPGKSSTARGAQGDADSLGAVVGGGRRPPSRRSEIAGAAAGGGSLRLVPADATGPRRGGRQARGQGGREEAVAAGQRHQWRGRVPPRGRRGWPVRDPALPGLSEGPAESAAGPEPRASARRQHPARAARGHHEPAGIAGEPGLADARAAPARRRHPDRARRLVIRGASARQQARPARDARPLGQALALPAGGSSTTRSRSPAS